MGSKPGDTQIYQDKIGFLGVPQSILFEGGELRLLPEYANNASYVDTHTHQDGFVYPLEVQIASAHRTLYRLPPSHELRLPNVVLSDAPRSSDAGFVLQAVAFAYGVRLQFADWWFDGRVPIRPCNGWRATRDDVADFSSSAYRVWRGYEPDSRKLITNLLYMMTRAASYNFDWEQFTFSYMVLDGCFVLAQEHHGVKARGHGDRIQAMCAHFGIPVQADVLENIVVLRNKLFHESLWANSTLGSPGGQDIYVLLLSLQKIVRRLLAALLGFDGHFVRSRWWTLDKDRFAR